MKPKEIRYEKVVSNMNDIEILLFAIPLYVIMGLASFSIACLNRDYQIAYISIAFFLGLTLGCVISYFSVRKVYWRQIK